MRIKLISLSLLLFLITSPTKAQDWEFVGLDSLVVLHLYMKGDTIYAGTWDKINNLNSGLYYSTDGGVNWSRLDSSLGEGAILGLEITIDQKLYIIKCPCGSGNAGTLYNTNDQGQSWQEVNNISSNRIRWLGVSRFNKNEMYAIDAIGVPGGLLSNLYRSTDRGLDWEILGPFPGSSHGSELTFSFDMTDSMSLYVSVDDHFTNLYLFKSTDKGDNWFFISTPPIIPKEIYSDYQIPDRLFLNPKPYMSIDGGLSWIDADSGFIQNSNYISFHQDTLTSGAIYILQTGGLYNSSNDTIYWNLVGGSEYLPLNMPDIRNLKNIVIDEGSNNIFLGTSSGIFRKSLITNLEILDSPEILSFNLEQNFPNPFNSSTIIKYNLPMSTYVVLKVYDLLGNELIVLVNEEKLKGSYEIEFTGYNFSSGVYIYTLLAGAQRINKKMILIK